MAFPLLVLRLLPVGLRGLMFSVIIAALMSGLDSIFNSAATLFTIDIWNHFRPNSSQKQQIWVGRIVVVVLCILSILWIPLVTCCPNIFKKKIILFYWPFLTGQDCCTKFDLHNDFSVRRSAYHLKA